MGPEAQTRQGHALLLFPNVITLDSVLFATMIQIKTNESDIPQVTYRLGRGLPDQARRSSIMSP